MLFKKDYILAGLIIILIITIGAFYTNSVFKKNKQEDLMKIAANKSFTVTDKEAGYTDLDGNKVQLTDYIGTTLVVNSWASWSPDSISDLQILQKIVTKYSDDKVKFLAINRSEPALTVKGFLNVYKISGKVKLLLDPDDKYYSSIDGFSMPETVIYDKAGNIYYHLRGRLTEEEVLTKLEKALLQ